MNYTKLYRYPLQRTVDTTLYYTTPIPSIAYSRHYTILYHTDTLYSVQ